MKKLTAFVLCVVLLVSTGSVLSKTQTEYTQCEIYCAPNGNDQNKGTLDSPLKTIDGARKKAAEIKKANKNAAVTVFLRGGEYKTDRTTTFLKGDSGTKEAPLVFAAYKDEKPILTGAAKIPAENFKPLSKAEAQRVPESARPYVGVADLKEIGIKGITPFEGYSGSEYVEKVKNTSVVVLQNDKEQTPAQWPNGINNFSLITDFASNSDITVDCGERMKNWQTAEEAMLCGWMHYGYSFSRVAVKEVYPESGRIVTKYDIPRGVKAGGEWQISNLLEELDVPGEYYVDTKALKVYYYPTAGGDDADIEIISNENTMLSFSGASYITFKGINFKNNRADAVEARNCNNLSFLGCEFKNIELMAVDTQYCTDITVDGCDFINIGSTGVRFDERNNGNDALSVDVASVRLDLSPDNNVVNNCYFWDVATQSVIYTGAVRVHGVGNKVTNCTMHEARSSFIHHGGNDIKMTNNEIYNGVKTSKDMGMVYNGRNLTQRGNETAYNYFHDWNTTSTHAGYATAIYDDDNLAGNYKHHNVFANGEKGVQNSGAPEGRFDYNIVARCALGANLDAQGLTAGSWMTSMKNFVSGQIPQVYTLKEYEKYTNIKNLFFKNLWPEIGVTVDGNLFFENETDKTNPAVLTDYVDLSTNIFEAGEEYKKYFNDPENGDFTIKSDAEVPSGLEEVKKIQLEDIGIYKSENRQKTEYNLGGFKTYYPSNYQEEFDSKNAYFAWEKSDNADEYIFELAKDPQFNDILKTEICPFNYAYLTDLDSGGTVYYWRVTAVAKTVKNPEKKMCENGVMTFKTNKYDDIDASGLEYQIEQTKLQTESMKEGENAGEVAPGTKDKINGIINEAKSYLKIKKGEQNLIDQTAAKLKEAVEKAYAETKIFYNEPAQTFENSENWTAGDTASLLANAGAVELKSTTSTMNANALFADEAMKFDGIKCFKIKPTVPKEAAGGTWQAIALMEKDSAGQKCWSQSGAASLLVVIKYDTVELQIRDGINSAKVISADSPLVMNEWNDVNFGIIDFGATQRCVLEINGERVVDFMNTDMLIKKDLYFGLYDAPTVTAAGTTGISAALGKTPDAE